LDTNKDIDELFKEALHKASKITYPLPDDIRLRLYAYYKHATQESINTTSVNEHELISAFKMNAWMQVRQMRIDDAKLEYVKLIDELYKNLKK